MHVAEFPGGAAGIDLLESALGEEFRSIRRARGLTQQGLADRANVSVGAVKNLESGSGSSLRTILRVLRVLDRLDWLEELHIPPPTFNPFDLAP